MAIECFEEKYVARGIAGGKMPVQLFFQRRQLANRWQQLC